MADFVIDKRDDGTRRHCTRSSARIERRAICCRAIAEIRRHVARFVVAEVEGRVVACAELAPLSGAVAEVRSLVVENAFRGAGMAGRLVERPSAARRSGGLRDVVRVHARRAVLRPPALHHRAASVGAREDCAPTACTAPCSTAAVSMPSCCPWPRRNVRPRPPLGAGPSPDSDFHGAAPGRHHGAGGFRAAGVSCGIKKRATGSGSAPLDLAIIAADRPASAAALFTTNKAVAAPVVVSREHLASSHGMAAAVVVNSGCANACTGEAGLKVAREMASATAAAFIARTPRSSSRRPA